MVIRGHIKNGVVVPDEPLSLPEGTCVHIQIPTAPAKSGTTRRGGIWKGQIHIADDFDSLPPDISEAFGIVAE